MVSTLTNGTNHAALDVANARSLGFDAFALNVGQPGADWAISTIAQVFAEAAKYQDFKLFFSLDTAQDGTLSDYHSLLSQYLGHPAYYRAGPKSYPFLSTFDAGTLDPAEWATFKNSDYAGELYFVPDFDNTQGYYDNPAAWVDAWKGVVDGAFSWETAWPGQTTVPTNVSTQSDINVMSALKAQGKTYMIGLSSLQFKALPNAHYYRAGEVNLPQRMTEILALGKTAGTSAPDFVETITWNDAGESHYIGNLWPEGIPASQLAYGNSGTYTHVGWQPLVQSFISAYKAGVSAASMVPPAGKQAVGAMWYRGIMTSASCASDPQGKPPGWQAARDAVNYAIVLPASASGMKVRLSSGGKTLTTVSAVPGLNYGSIPYMTVGAQKIELLNSAGVTVMNASSVVDVAAQSTGVCNYNYLVAGLM